MPRKQATKYNPEDAERYYLEYYKAWKDCLQDDNASWTDMRDCSDNCAQAFEAWVNAAWRAQPTFAKDRLDKAQVRAVTKQYMYDMVTDGFWLVRLRLLQNRVNFTAQY